MTSEEIESWPIPGLTFVKVVGVERTLELDRSTEEQQDQREETTDPKQSPKRLYLMEDALTGMNSQLAYLAYAVIGSKSGITFYTGMSLQAIPEGMDESDIAETCYDIQKSILHNVYKGIETAKDLVPDDKLKMMINPLANNVGIVTGLPSLANNNDSMNLNEQVERIASGMQGLDFGIVILAAPVPIRKVVEEEFIIKDYLQRARDKSSEELSALQSEIDFQEAYLKQVLLGVANGVWLVIPYFFAPTMDAFVRLEALIKAMYFTEKSGLVPIRTHSLEGLKSHLCEFGLLRNIRKNVNRRNRLLDFKYLTPMNSRMLSAFIQLPKRNLPGFTVRRSE